MQLEDYLNLLTSQHRNKPKLAESIRAVVEPLCVVQQHIETLPTYFNLDTATGDQLFTIAKWVGAPTVIPNAMALPLFGFDGQENALTFGDTQDEQVGGFWRESGLTGYTSASIDHELLRKLIKAQIFKNQCDCTLENAYTVLNLFIDEDYTIFDSEQMWIGIGITTEITDMLRQLIRLMFPKPMGVGIRFFNHWKSGFGWVDQPDSLGFGETTDHAVGGFWVEEIF